MKASRSSRRTATGGAGTTSAGVAQAAVMLPSVVAATAPSA